MSIIPLMRMVKNIQQGTLLNPFQILLKDGNSSAYYDRTIPEGVVKDENGVESIYWDLIIGNKLRSEEQASGNIVLYAVYEITATTADFFYTGCQVGDIFPCGVVKTCSVTNKVKRVLGNHACQPVFSKRPINGVFDSVDDFMKTAPFTLIQPTMLYLGFSELGWTASRAIIDGNLNYSGLVQQTGYSNFMKAYAGLYSNYLPPQNIDGSLDGYLNKSLLLQLQFNTTISTASVNGSAVISGDFGNKNMGGITIGTNANMADFSNIKFYNLIARSINETADNKRIIYSQLKNKIKSRTICFLGDSTISTDTSAPVDWSPISKLMASDFLRIEIAQPGATIANNKSKFLASKGVDMDAVFLQTGLNDLGMTSANLIAAYQDLVNTIRTELSSSGKIIISTMIPCSRSSSQKWTDLNNAILGLGATPITGVDGRINTVDTDLNAGDNTLKEIYRVASDTEVGLHENDLARQIIADLWDAKLIELGVII